MQNRKEIRMWSGEHRGIPWEIKNFKIGLSKEDGWTFYIYLREKQIPELFESLWLDDYKSNIGNHYFYNCENTIISNLDWHGGCTYYKKVSGFDHEQRAIKVGCDYQHYFDEGVNYNVTVIEQDIISCINSLYEYTNVLQWCTYCGNFVDKLSKRQYCEKCEKEN